MVYYNEEQLLELKKELDEKAAWFNDASYGDIEVNISIDELIDKAYDFVQLAFEYRNIQPDAKREDVMRVAKLRERLNIDFFLETQRILSNAHGRTNVKAEFLREFTKISYHFTYNGFGSFYYINSERKGYSIFILSTIATLAQEKSEFFQFFAANESDNDNKLPVSLFEVKNGAYNLLLAIYMHKWLRWQISQFNLEQKLENESDFKPNLTKTLNKIDDIFIDENSMETIMEILKDEGFLNDNGVCIKNSGIRAKVSAIFNGMKKIGNIKNEYFLFDNKEIANRFMERFSIDGFSVKQLIYGCNEDNNSLEFERYLKILSTKLKQKKKK